MKLLAVLTSLLFVSQVVAVPALVAPRAESTVAAASLDKDSSDLCIWLLGIFICLDKAEAEALVASAQKDQA